MRTCKAARLWSGRGCEARRPLAERRLVTHGAHAIVFGEQRWVGGDLVRLDDTWVANQRMCLEGDRHRRLCRLGRALEAEVVERDQ